MWTEFMDMCSGGSPKEKWSHIFIEADEDTATKVFYNRYGHNPKRVTCTCCGPDYSISSDESLEHITAYNRNCQYENGKYVEGGPGKYGMPYVTLEEYLKDKNVKFIFANEILEEEKKGDVPEQGYVWV